MFLISQPVWIKGKETEMNVTAGFRAVIGPRQDKNVILKVTASSVYRCFVNGVFVGHGPAVAPHGMFRVDEWEIKGYLTNEHNVIAVEAAGYNANSFYWLDQPSFVQIEVLSGDEVLAATSPLTENENVVSFQGTVLPERIQRFPRYSFQRPFAEGYRLRQGYNRWRSEHTLDWSANTLSVQEPKTLLHRKVPYASYDVIYPIQSVCRGEMIHDEQLETSECWKDRSLTDIGPTLKGYREVELEWNPSIELQQLKIKQKEMLNVKLSENDRVSIDASREAAFHTIDMGRNVTGFFSWQMECTEPSTCYVIFDEILNDRNEVDFKRLQCYNVISFQIEPGQYDFLSMELYTLRYATIIVTQGKLDVFKFHLKEYANPETNRAQFRSSDARLNHVFTAGVETFRQNAVDNFLDCPSRERAGWLCDSYFTARAALDLCGNTKIEDQFIENFLLPKSFPHLPDGMLPMCYPADHFNGQYIPNWALWFVVQLKEYAQRSTDQQMVQRLEKRIENLFAFFETYQNEDGLLEKLDSWVFVEWSKANDFVQDVNYPSNMLYAGALEAAGCLYHRIEWIEKAKKLKQTIREQALSNGGIFFRDHAIRSPQGMLIVLDDVTEVCQYYAFYFGVADPEQDRELWQTLITSFGPNRDLKMTFPEVHPANAFIGYYLRLELLSREGLTDQILNESTRYFYKMAETTGTLWEHDGPYASCCHGFASHIVHVFYRDIVGIYDVNRQSKQITIRIRPNSLQWCEAVMPIDEHSVIRCKWKKTNGRLNYSVRVPDGYKVQMINDLAPDM